MKCYDVSAMTDEGELIKLGTYASRDEAYDAAYDAVDNFEYQGIYAKVTVFKAWSSEVDLQLNAIEPPH